jgi:hypothetical protein
MKTSQVSTPLWRAGCAPESIGSRKPLVTAGEIPATCTASGTSPWQNHAMPSRSTAPFVAAVAFVVSMGAAAAKPEAPMPVDATTGVLDAFRGYRVVAIGEAHGNEQEHAFFRALIRDPRFVSAGIDLVVEFGNALYQPVVDRFVNGESVDAASLRRVWQNTTIPGVTWDVPVYEAFYREARHVNASLPPHQRIRVLLGDPAVDWDRADRGGWRPASTGRLGWPTDDERYDRDFHVVTVIRREVLPRKRRALVIQGAHHVYRTSSSSLVATLEARFGVKVFSIVSSVGRGLEIVQPDVSWLSPGLAKLRGTTLGALDSDFLLPNKRPGFSAQDNFDAVLYVGAEGSLTSSRLTRAQCGDPEYVAMRRARLGLWSRSSEALQDLADKCAAALGSERTVQ